MDTSSGIVLLFCHISLHPIAHLSGLIRLKTTICASLHQQAPAVVAHDEGDYQRGCLSLVMKQVLRTVACSSWPCANGNGCDVVEEEAETKIRRGRGYFSCHSLRFPFFV
jgi:hypothetical protein